MDRQSLEIITQFGDGGRQPGQWFAVHASRRTRRATSTRPRRTRENGIQKFVAKGMGTVSDNQGVLWPKR